MSDPVCLIEPLASVHPCILLSCRAATMVSQMLLACQQDCVITTLRDVHHVSVHIYSFIYADYIMIYIMNKSFARAAHLSLLSL